MRKVKCAVLGATGVVGQYFLRLLDQHPYFELAAVCASDARSGQKLGDVKALTEEGIPADFIDLTFDPIDVSMLKEKKVDIAFSALPADVAKTVEMDAARAGIHIFSNASAYRMDAQVPILIPEINSEHLLLAAVQMRQRDGFIITNANCTTTGLTMALLPLKPFGIKRLIVASYQAVSGAGYPGIPAMDISGNVIPHIMGEEPKLRKECVKIFGQVNNDTIRPADWEVHAHCVRVPTISGHLISVHVELSEKFAPARVLESYIGFEAPQNVTGLPTAPVKPVLYTDDPSRPQPRWDVNAGTPERASGMAVTVGKLEATGNIVRFVTLSHNLVRGAAGGSILNAELAYKANLI